MEGIDKLLAPIAGRPLLAWTLEALAASPVVARIVVVASAANVGAIRGAPWLPDRVSRVVLGGDRRQLSVAAGVEALRDGADGDRSDRVVLVHDGARPLVSGALIEAVASAAETPRGGDPGPAGRRDRQAGGGRAGRRDRRPLRRW